MLVKLTSKRRITLPTAVVPSLGEAEYFEVTIEGDRIVLTPVPTQKAYAVREKLRRLGITEQDVEAALDWAHQQ
ncbi:AbrB family transcriptional regulator [Pseudoxanthomonas broegbernensis]|uniref:AbrB family transcriptional regulator n=1 Tax=Pseudoxanthomonas broegbernensis TaxID=83619 RepID=A0A7V8GNY1_9GAMM|nr:AbrB/MazE/SpoVT family DNA-binding domain-containing protein [Pseudoxanthomonas broegbernensis]KAF1687360.1 AbrB family transcriptional regulator [Pseudoxanthomonas broegbernensis]MBB6065637.1 bifunctional DNA-binding transcriptional regulator/antitoxin component of YhaV-PrlF toxin-antitoxin module [Pseudoxanthomonas broegbernensis]